MLGTHMSVRMYVCMYVYAHVRPTLPICGLGVVLLLVFPFTVFSQPWRSHLVNIQLLVVVCVCLHNPALGVGRGDNGCGVCGD